MTFHREMIETRDGKIANAQAAFARHVDQSGYVPGDSIAVITFAQVVRDVAIAHAWQEFNIAMAGWRARSA